MFFPYFADLSSSVSFAYPPPIFLTTEVTVTQGSVLGLLFFS